MEDCIFCKIINKRLPSEIIYEDEETLVFKDIHPKAEVHLLIVPKKHIKSINEATEKDERLLGRIFLTAKKVAEDLNLVSQGYKLVLNVGRGAGQIINHIHLHLLSGNYNQSLGEI